MEYGKTTDEPTFVFLNRNLPTPQFTQSTENDWLTIQTSSVQLQYHVTSTTSFDHTNLKVTVRLKNNEAVTWSPQPTGNRTNAGGNLLGTFKSLDGETKDLTDSLNCYGNNKGSYCELGLVSRDGFAVIDDTNRPAFDNSDWPWLINSSLPEPSTASCDIPQMERQDCSPLGEGFDTCVTRGCCQGTDLNGIPHCYYSTSADRDLYFFGHGHNYTQALWDFVQLAGRIALPPKYAFGVYYSRFWAYSDFEEKDIVRSFEEHSIPLDVLVLDMDWHYTFDGHKPPTANGTGWNGYTFDKHLFPNPRGFLAWCHAKGVHVTVNVHPAAGIQPWEEKYAEMAHAMGIDPSTNETVPFDLPNKKFVSNWFDIVLAEREQQGIDFWWLDWGPGYDYWRFSGASPVAWMAYIFSTDPTHWNQTGLRPLTLNRYGGLGNHRYQVGFSGDTYATWETLAFQVYFTITASNVAFGYWSHDIGSHRSAAWSEIYIRWTQWGCFSPIFRPHPKKDPNMFRLIWKYPADVYPLLRSYFVLRAALVPYIYTFARVAYATGISLIRPVYYLYPDAEQSYDASLRTQYFFGDAFFVSPVVSPQDNDTQLANTTIWFPGDANKSYVGLDSGLVFSGSDTLVSLTWTLAEAPVFGVAGSVVPMRIDSSTHIGSAQEIPDGIKLLTFVGGKIVEGAGWLYDDDGKTNAYEESGKNQTASTYFSFSSSADELVLKISKALGADSVVGFPKNRSYQIQFLGAWPASKVLVNGKSIISAPYETICSEDCWSYDGSSLSLYVHLQPSSVAQEVSVNVANMFPLPSTELGMGFPRILRRLMSAKSLLDVSGGNQEDCWSLLTAAETGERITDNIQSAEKELKTFMANLHDGVEQVRGEAHLDQTAKRVILAQLTS
ncbi:oligosaccharide 4-alpha-D-glucosyltransferase-like [Oscarella lobularis]|uniref:oligosaccharide 4-alpha-D-glucosyltransferase-like n=1 Tax=Oscarella lobularis TaxID=121494 RepID=UPI003313D646